MILAVAAIFASSAVGAAQRQQSVVPCSNQIYRLGDGRFLDLTYGKTTFRWRLSDGRTGSVRLGETVSRRGWTDEIDGVNVDVAACGEGRVSLIEPDGRALEGRAFPLISRSVRFKVDGAELSGRLVLPTGGTRVPVVVMAQGSGDVSALDNNFQQRLYPALGVGVFVYDKRGTGRSSGTFTYEFKTLAADLRAAVDNARRLAGRRVGRLGIQGTSQGGWVAPLASISAKLDFLIVINGLADSPVGENRDEALQDLTQRGYAGPALAQAADAINATEAIVRSNFASGYEHLAEIKRKYGLQPWFKNLKGEFTGDVLSLPEDVLRAEGPKMNRGLDWFYEPMPVLRRLEAPTLWILSELDTETPIATTQKRLTGLQCSGARITIVLFPGAEHELKQVEVNASGERRETRYVAGAFQVPVEWAKNGRISRQYGQITTQRPAARGCS